VHAVDRLAAGLGDGTATYEYDSLDRLAKISTSYSAFAGLETDPALIAGTAPQ